MTPTIAEVISEFMPDLRSRDCGVDVLQGINQAMRKDLVVLREG